jgi:hypothetical protein
MGLFSRFGVQALMLRRGSNFRVKLTASRLKLDWPVMPLNQSRWFTTYHLKVTQVTLRDSSEA